MKSVRKNKGSVLLAIVIMLVLISASSYWVALRGHQSLRTTAGASEQDIVRELRHAARAHGAFLAASGSCAAVQSATDVPLGGHSYSLVLDASNPSTTLSFDPTHDSYIEESNSAKTNEDHGDLHSQLKPGEDRHGLMRFDISSLTPGAVVQSATLHLWVHEEDADWPIAVHENTSTFTEADVSWENFSAAYNPNPVALVPPSSSKDHWVRVPLTAVVQRWLNNPFSNYGVRFVSTEEGTESKLSSKEHTDVAERPYLTITLASAANKTALLQASTTLDSGRELPVLVEPVPLLQEPQTLILQPGPEAADAWYDAENNDDDELEVSASGSYAALKFAVGQIPRGAQIISAQLQLYPEAVATDGTIVAQMFTAIWDESQITESTARFLDPWARNGGEVDNALVHEAQTVGTGESLVIPVAETVQRWVDGTANYGFRLSTSDADARLSSSDTSAATQRPRLVVRYSCPCGQSCEPGSGNDYELLYIVDRVLGMSEQEQLRYDTFQDWGYDVSLVSDDIFRFSSSSLSGKDLVYVSGEVNETRVGALTNTTVGVVNENRSVMNLLGISQNIQNHASQILRIDDIAESITAGFPLQDIEVGERPVALISHGLPAPGALSLASVDSRPALLALRAGAEGIDGSAAPSNRVGLPFGPNSNWAQLSNDALLMIRTSMEWAVSGSSAATFCNADYSPGFVERTVSVAGGSLQDVTWVPEGAELDAVLAPAGGAWVTVDALGQVFRMIDNSGGVLATLSAPTNDPAGIAYIDAGDHAGKWVYVDWWNERLVIMDASGAIEEQFDTARDDLYTTSGVAFLGLTPDGTYDGHFAVIDEYSSSIVFYDQAGDAQKTIALAGTEFPKGIEHLPGSNKLLVTYPGRRAIVDFDGIASSTNDAGQPAEAEGTSIHGDTCQHVLADADTGTLKFLQIATAAVAQWPLDEAAGVATFDTVDSREASLSATPWLETGVTGAALAFDGSSSVMRIGADPLFALDRGYSVSGWIFPTAIGGVQGIISNSSYFELSLSGGDLLLSSGGSLPQQVSTSGGPVALEEWSYISATVDSDGGVALYVNGVEEGSGTLSASSPASTDDLLVGVNRNGDHFEGAIDAVSIYHDVVPALELAAQHLKSAPASGANPFCSVAADDFESRDWGGSTGDLPWLGDWVEVNEPTNPTSGDIVVGKPFGWVARLRDNDGGGEGIERAIDLSAFSRATLRFDYWRSALEPNDHVIVSFSNDNGASWSELAQLFGPGTDDLAGPGLSTLLTLPGPLTSASKIRMLTWSGMGANDRVYIDNIAITACP